MSKSLVVVESPAKARTIGKYLGPNFVIKATMGHIIDLPVKEFGIDLADGFTPKYVVMKGKQKIIKEIQKSAAGADKIFLALDPDREGEAIAWHVSRILPDQKAKLNRIMFHEITKTAIQAAVKNPLELDMHKVHAQQARRILDRIVGYKISPFLWKAIYRGLSAGRVQSVALRIISEREAEREAFQKEEFWTLEAVLKTTGGETVTAKLAKVRGEDPRLPDAASVQAIMAALANRPFTVNGLEKKEKRKNPYPPFITSTMQQDAAHRLHFSASKTMQVAQQLYEGVDLGGTPTGLITYMRTDSTRIADEAQLGAAKYVKETYGPQYVPAQVKVYKKSENSQDAHEAIRPTYVDPAHAPAAVRDSLTPDQFKLYNLVWQRFLASQMEPALFDSTAVDFQLDQYLFRANGSIRKFDGFTRVYGEEADDAGGDDKDTLLPPLSINDVLAREQWADKQHFTQPPPRYSEATLVRELEKQGIGRPSTYAQIIDTLKRRTYVTLEERRFAPTQLGRTVNKILVDNFPDFFNVSFTAGMEDELDKVESGAIDWKKLLENFYGPLAKSLVRMQAGARDLKKVLEEKTGQNCELCGSPLVIKWGRNGRFISCSAYPKCHNTKPLEKEEQSGLTKTYLCSVCQSPMVVKRWKMSRFLGCSKYPECRHTQAYPIGMDCPEPGCAAAGGYLVERYSPRGKLFFSCARYPACKFASWNKPVAVKCPACEAPFMVERVTKTKGTSYRCLKCKHEVVKEQEDVE